MIRETTYSNGSRTVVVRHERTDTWMESPDTILNFPGLVVLDGGRSWSAPTTTGWPGVKPRLHLLPNGVLACASGRGAYGHPQVTYVMLSLDGTGEHWEYPFAFHTGPGCSYTSTMVRDGMLHVVHSHSDFTRDFGTHGLAVQAIKRAVIGVEVVGG